MEQKLNLLGSVILNCKFKNQKTLVKFVVVHDNFVPILGLSTCTDFNLIIKVHTVN